MQGDLFGGKYTVEEVKELLDINARPPSIMKPMNPFYKKSAEEHGPSWAQKKEVTLFHSLVSSFTGSSTNQLSLHLPRATWRSAKSGFQSTSLGDSSTVSPPVQSLSSSSQLWGSRLSWGGSLSQWFQWFSFWDGAMFGVTKTTGEELRKLLWPTKSLQEQEASSQWSESMWTSLIINGTHWFI